MEPISENFCLICLTKPKPSELITFSCKHPFCHQCTPYLFLNSLKSTNQILKEFLQNDTIQVPCPICSSGYAKIPIKNLVKGNDVQNKRFCDGCDENEAVSLCVDCNKTFCNDCSNRIHIPKKYQNHRFSDLNQPVNNDQRFQCICPGKHYLSHVCVTCRKAICAYCLKVEHEKHELTSIEELAKKFQESNQQKLKLLSETCRNLVTSINVENQQFNQIIEEIVLGINILKEKSLQKHKQCLSQIELAQSILAMIHQETNQKELHPNKQLIIFKTLENIKFNKEEQVISEELDTDKKRITSMKIKKLLNTLGELIAQKKTTIEDSKQFYMCSKHQNEQMKFICQDHHEFLCGLCLKDHETHVNSNKNYTEKDLLIDIKIVENKMNQMKKVMGDLSL